MRYHRRKLSSLRSYVCRIVAMKRMQANAANVEERKITFMAVKYLQIAGRKARAEKRAAVAML